MLVKITHLKAPWPSGARVGDVVDLPAVPVWAVGKCVQAVDGDAVTIGEGAAPSLEVDPEEAKISAALAEADAQHAEERAKAEAKASKGKAK